MRDFGKIETATATETRWDKDDNNSSVLNMNSKVLGFGQTKVKRKNIAKRSSTNSVTFKKNLIFKIYYKWGKAVSLDMQQKISSNLK